MSHTVEAEHTLNNFKEEMILAAHALHGADINPTKGSWADSFTEHNGGLMLWYDTPDMSTHVIIGRFCPECGSYRTETICRCKKGDLL